MIRRILLWLAARLIREAVAFERNRIVEHLRAGAAMKEGNDDKWTALILHDAADAIEGLSDP